LVRLRTDTLQSTRHDRRQLVSAHIRALKSSSE
jgi:hypothetical protein